MRHVCFEKCEHLRSFRPGFDGKKMIIPYDHRERLATCALNPEVEMQMRRYPLCWRESEK